jgi:TetR/AcrR family transcriptional regulator
MTEIPTETSTKIPPKKRVRRSQERAEATRSKLINAARVLFSERGFESVSLRDIENAAEVKRGLLAYHFDDKETFWKVVADDIFNNMKIEFDQRLAILHELPKSGRLSFIVRFHVGYHARHPELGRLMSQEAIHDTWRIKHLIDTHIRPSAKTTQQLASKTLDLDEKSFVHWYYIMISASSTVFSFAPECIQLFGIDPAQDDFVEDHSKMLIGMLLNQSSE